MAKDMAVAKEEVLQRLERELKELGQRLEAVQKRVKGSAQETKDRYKPLIERLGANLEALRSATDRLRNVAGDVAAAVVEDLDQARERLKTELAAVRSQLDAETAQTKAAYREALRPQLDARESRIDELRVQLDLAEMDARDELSALLGEMERAYAAAQYHLDRAGDDTAETLDNLRRGTRQVIGDLEAAVAAASKQLAQARASH